ncbi:stage VI sporulation protein D [Niallia sp. NCCP-28]|uniref:stage VI sporulation protein D n=1 Tax=Niallia sp. NCCP-28 TaxID=2934712 RepID=UPI0020813EB6|nr:stage VI sporulation protein D [Niallia sp. NCCP-28]GKU81460.1 stage VI sporulation protein D [Niallia sp. NCCP-28]
MSLENASNLRFSLEESVWFQKGQEVADLLSISLDPNITIQENDQYITIQGSLELTGEYIRVQEEQEEEEVFQTPKLVHSVMEREEGICEFLHHFPVDITIPRTRISSLEEIEVDIETFDYVFPERSCLNLTADLSISGLANYGEQEEGQEPEAEEVEEFELAFRGTEEVELPVWEVEEEPVEIKVSPLQGISPLIEEDADRIAAEEIDDLYAPFETEVRRSPEEEQEVQEEEDVIIPFFVQPESEEEKNPAAKSDVAIPEMKVSMFRNEKEIYSAEEVFQKPPQESSELKLEESSYEQEEKEPVMEEESSSSDGKQGKKKKSIFNKTKSLTFTEFFARKEEETHTKIKICIVQHGETLESLSDRYNVNALSILKENRMEANQDISEGQVLYIPVKFTQK